MVGFPPISLSTLPENGNFIRGCESFFFFNWQHCTFHSMKFLCSCSAPLLCRLRVELVWELKKSLPLTKLLAWWRLPKTCSVDHNSGCKLYIVNSYHVLQFFSSNSIKLVFCSGFNSWDPPMHKRWVRLLFWYSYHEEDCMLKVGVVCAGAPQ